MMMMMMMNDIKELLPRAIPGGAQTPKSSMLKYKTFIVGYSSACKGKATPVQAWPGHEHSRRLRLPHFKTVGP